MKDDQGLTENNKTQEKRSLEAACVHLIDCDVSDAEITEVVLTSHWHLPPQIQKLALESDRPPKCLIYNT